MALVLADRVQETATANTTVSFTLTGAVTGYQSFSVIGNTNTTFYSAYDVTGNWEVGLGTYASSGTTLTRTTIISSSNSSSAVTFSGTVNVFVTYPSSKSVNLDASNNATINSTGSLTLPVGTTGQRPGAPANGMIRVNTTTNILEIYSSSTSSWLSVNTGTGSSSTYTRTSFTATSGQTTFSAAYAVGYVEVYLNGAFLNGTDYTATDGATVVLASAAALSDIVETVAFNTSVVVPGIGGGAVMTLSTTATVSGTIPVGTNGFSVGPVTIASGVAITVASGQRWLVV